ncbi:amidase, Asp-tRNAAsn/Glu-tRNAGln amidotransferase A subunit [Herbaspirillum sp. CF444]|uniref:amidase n=1 Tax=Herbaspirillum sp. CF444 TaxID=1144319 RepID=UPI000272516B|nr:amidase [Herbaspirillum sp. CF444]EJL92697.1 amidase, Asp-tRNAAsn/Glu-tRNAGln amidotransferase A subunit [Herbaspirillum sp. CF444]
MKDELWRLDAAQLAAGYRSGAFTPVQALEACLARIAQCQPAINAMVVIDADGARAAAQASLARWNASAPLGPLDGVPVSVKDNMHVAGMPTTWGSRLLQGFVAARDELPVARLRSAGAVLIGKTNLPEFAMQGYTWNGLHGASRNPWNTALTPGGSSGGAAAAVAAGCGPLALATDGGGSIRRPASHCGLVGFKPSAGLVPRSDGLPEIFLDYEVAGGIGRSVADVAAFTRVLAGCDLTAPVPHRARILFVPRFGGHPVDAGIAAQLAQAADRFAALGHDVVQSESFELAEEINQRWSALSTAGLVWMMERVASYPEFAAACGTGTEPELLLGNAAREHLSAGRRQASSALFETLAAVRTLKLRLSGIFSQYDAILTPATAALPWPAEQTHPAAIAGSAVGPRGHAIFTAFANAAGLPAIALPTGLVEGMPTGLQLIGMQGRDAGLLALAQQYEHAHPWQERWPDAGYVPV